MSASTRMTESMKRVLTSICRDDKPFARDMSGIPANTAKALVQRGWAEVARIPEPHLFPTDAGRAITANLPGDR